MEEAPQKTAVPCGRLSRTVVTTALTATLLISLPQLGGAREPPPAPYKVEQSEIAVAMADGVRLWGCLTKPVAAKAGERFPALLTLDPYSGGCAKRRTDYTALAGQGYATAYFHVRGTGRSAGRFPSREYSEAELQDAVALIDWLSGQPWSTGRVGMFGASWSGFNAIQVAMRRPPALKAIIPSVATEDIYHEDVHFADGILRFDDYNMLADLSLITSPPSADPLDEGTLKNRFDQTPWSLVYLRQQRDGDFWRRHIRLDANPQALTVPVLMIGGWYDGYRTSIDRALRHLRTPAKAIVGPWDHSNEQPPPAANLEREALRWWDYWLKDQPTGVLEDPQLIAYMRRPHLPGPKPGPIPGEWRQFAKWPPADLSERRYFLSKDRRLATEPTAPATHTLRYVPSGGIQAGIWWGDPMPDQRGADAHSLVYESEPVGGEVHTLGRPTATLRASASAVHANWYVRLSDVAPDGTVTLITGGALNGTHRNAPTAPEPLVPGQTYTLEVPLHFTSWIFEPGHRLRVAVSNALWPMFWPTPYPMTTALEVGSLQGSSLTLPVIPPANLQAAWVAASLASANVATGKPSAPPASNSNKENDWIGPARIERDEVSGSTTVSYTIARAPGAGAITVQYRLEDTHPERAGLVGTCTERFTVDGRTTEWRGRTEIASDLTTFHYRHHRQLLRDGTVVRERTWQEAVPRDGQ
ncbi:MAG: CocE/NonD family hydrolase [Aphanocapsa lilacina HA4352-LM1]|jgi:putative CocE/NonD family hydrolase|nr:CocE/NonD family hydrolase [Aphanocapsa lilacina HA4352-LM1]